MYRNVQIIARDGQIHQVPMTAQQAAFCYRLAEMKAAINPTITFHDVVIEQQAQMRRARTQN
jgi:hypothetical protein